MARLNAIRFRIDPFLAAILTTVGFAFLLPARERRHRLPAG